MSIIVLRLYTYVKFMLDSQLGRHYNIIVALWYTARFY